MSISKNLRFVDVSAALLAQGYGVRFRASGGSMTPAIGDGDVITVKPVETASLTPGRVIVYRDCDRVFAHRVVSVHDGRTAPGTIVVRGDAAREVDAPIAPSQVLGEVVSVAPRAATRSVAGLLQRAAAVAMAALWALLIVAAAPQTAQAAVLQQVQSGTAVNTADGIQTITISSVDMTKSFLVFQTRSSGDRPVNSMVRGRIASATTIQFERETNEGAPLAINIQWYVATFGSGVTVQRGTATMSALTVNVGITAVAAMNQAFVLWSLAPNPVENEFGSDDVIAGDLTSTTNLQFRTNDPASAHIVWWQVVEFTDPADINVQRGTVTTMIGAATSVTATLPTAVNPAQTFVLASFRTEGAGADVGGRLLRTQLTNATTITFDRGNAGSPDNMPEITWQAVELRDGSMVTRGNASFATGVSQVVAPFAGRVNTTRAIAFMSGQANGQSMGRTGYAANDVPGVAMATAALSPTQLTLDRNSTLDTADIGWFVIQFAGGDGFKVGSFTKTPGAAPATQAIPHNLGEVPKALILWTEGRSNESFSNVSGISFRAASTGSSASGVLTLTLPVPAGTATNDVMIASVGLGSNSATITAPAGWTLIRRTNSLLGSANALAVYWKAASTSEPASYVWTFSASAGAAGGIRSFSGVDVADPIDVENGSTTLLASLSHTAPSVTTTVANAMIVTSHAFASSATWTPPAGMTEAFDVASNAVPAGAGISIVGSYALQAAAGATGTKVATAANDADTGNTHTLALNPAPAGTAYFGYGVTDGTRSRSVSTSSQNGVATSNASTRMANKVLTMVRWGQAVVAEADLASWNDTTFTLNWTTNDANTYVIHFIAIGGSDIQARVVDWQMRQTNGNQTVTGVGFQPDVVFHAHGGHTFNNALPASVAGGAFGLGVMDFDGDQWALANWTLDNLATSDTQRGQVTDAAIYSFNNTLTVQKRASWVSMNADGFTLNFTNTTSNVQARVFSLALKGLNVKPGSFLKSTGAAPATQAITGVGFRPSLVMLASVQSTTQANPVAHARFGLGASDGATSGSSAVQDEDAAAFSNVDAIDKTSRVFMKVDNGTPVIDAEANLASTGTDGFTLNWTTNDAVQTEILYLSLAPLAVTEVKLISFTASRESQGVHLAWKTGYEVSNLGFHLYREIDGRRTRITRSLVAGSGLVVGSRNRVTTEQSYGFWDRDAAARSARAVYWLEDVDFNGKSTWHGPVTPTAPVLVPGAIVADSPMLAGLGRGAGYRHERFTAAPDPESLARQPTLNAESAVTAEESRLAQWAIASQPAVKLGINETGWYRVDQPALVAAGLDPQADPATLRLFLEGVEQPILVTGADDGRFESGDAIEFYGIAADTAYTDTAVYWLTSGTGTGLRVQRTAPASAGAPAPPRFWGTIERKDRSIYFAALRNGGAENWFGDLIADGAPVGVGVTVRHPDAAAPGDALLDVILQGVTISADAVLHQVRVRVNGTEVGVVEFEGRSLGSAALAVPHALLTEGANTVQFEALGGETDLSLFSTLRLGYWHTADADDDELLMTADAEQTVRIDGFTTAGDVRVVDVTDPQAILELQTDVESVPGAVVVQTPGSGTRTLLAFRPATIRTPLFVNASQPSALHEAGQSHDYLIVAHPDFVAQMAPLAAHRATQGYQTAVISIDDVYDEFSFGQHSPDALKDFLARARATWTVAPRFVVLAGDATFDPRDYAGLGFGDFVPTSLVDMAETELETASDDWFVDANGDGLPEIAIGRLPIRTAPQAAGTVAKIVAYDTQPAGAWSRSVSLVTDTDDPTVRFRASSAALVTRVPSSVQVNRLDRDVLGAAMLRQDLFTLVNQGQLIVNYLGHGSTYIWGTSGEMLASADIGGNWSTTGSRLPFVVAMNCLNGFFQGIYGEESLAETLMRNGGGAVAVWASSSLTEAEPQAVMNDELFRLLFSTTGAVGDAVRLAKSAVPSPDVRRSWVFFGDPAMRLKGLPIETPPLPTLTATPATLNFAVVTSASGATASASQTVRLTQNGTGAVSWNATADQPWIQIVNGGGTGSGRFTIGVLTSSLPPAGTVTGTVTITASGAQSSPTVAVRVSIIGSGTSTAPYGTIDTPLQGASGLSGSIPVTGWALDDVGVSRVQIFRDPVSPEAGGPVYLGDAMFVPGARPDVEAVYPDVPSSSRAGWGFMLLSNMLPNQGSGVYTIHALASDLDGNLAWIGTRSFASDNASATAPFGSIDTPGVAEVASGTTYVNFGWVLTQQPKIVPIDGSTISVLVDGVVVGHPGPLAARSDIQSLFPGYANTDHAVGAFALDTTTYADGLHTISWIVTDSGGQTSGIGSRYFIIDNSGGATGSVTQSAEGSAAAETFAEAEVSVLARTGVESGAPFEVVEARGHRRQVVARELDRVELVLSGDADGNDGWRYRGYHVVGSERRALPVGSTLDAATGRFSWQPSAGFVGTYALQFVRTSVDGREEQIAVDIVLRPLHRSASNVRVAIDVPAPGDVSGTFAVAGWAIDRGAPRGTGIDAVHVWAYPNPGSGALPIFLGAARLGDVRSDVGAYFGERFAPSSYDLVVDGLAPGTYDLAVFPHSTLTGQFDGATVVRVVVK